MSNVTKFYPKNAAENPDNVLEQAVGEYNDVLIIGWDKDGNLDSRSSTLFSDGGELLWLIETFKKKLLDGDFRE